MWSLRKKFVINRGLTHLHSIHKLVNKKVKNRSSSNSNLSVTIFSLSISCYSFSTFSLIIRRLMNLADNKQRRNWPFIMIIFINRERKMGERKIDVTATLRHAPTTGAEFMVSDVRLVLLVIFQHLSFTNTRLPNLVNATLMSHFNH